MCSAWKMLNVRQRSLVLLELWLLGENPAMYAGHLTPPASCVQDWVRLALSTGTHFTCFHHHLIYMLSSNLGKAERKAINALTSTAAVLDYMQNHWDLHFPTTSHSEAL